MDTSFLLLRLSQLLASVREWLDDERAIQAFADFGLDEDTAARKANFLARLAGCRRLFFNKNIDWKSDLRETESSLRKLKMIAEANRVRSDRKGLEAFFTTFLLGGASVEQALKGGDYSDRVLDDVSRELVITSRAIASLNKYVLRLSGQVADLVAVHGSVGMESSPQPQTVPNRKKSKPKPGGQRRYTDKEMKTARRMVEACKRQGLSEIEAKTNFGYASVTAVRNAKALVRYHDRKKKSQTK